MNKKILSFILVVVMIMSMGVLVIAEENLKNNADDNALFQFQEFCSDYFMAPDDYIVWDRSGKDISQEFYENTIQIYNSEDIRYIYDYAKENVFRFSKLTISSTPDLLKGSLQTQRVSDWFYEMVKTGQYCPDFELQYTISGSYVYNVNTGEIVSYTGPAIDISYCSLVGVWSYSMKSVTTRAVVAPNKYSIAFSGNFKLDTVCAIPIGGISGPGYREEHGPFYGIINSYPEM